MRLVNFSGKEVNILHFQGSSTKDQYNGILPIYKDNKFNAPSDLSIITTYTDPKLCSLIHQCELNNIPLINSADYLKVDEFKHQHKLISLLNAAKITTTKYLLILDGYDVIINNLDNIIEKFLSYKTQILFNATKAKYPLTTLDKIRDRDWLGEFNYLNSGCIIGERYSLIRFLSECVELLNDENNRNPYDSDQYYVRLAFSKYSYEFFNDNNYIKFDYLCKIFICVGGAQWVPSNNEVKLI